MDTPTLTPQAREYDSVFQIVLVPERAGEQVMIGDEQITVPCLDQRGLQFMGQLALGMSRTEIAQFEPLKHRRIRDKLAAPLRECGYAMGLSEVFPPINDCSLVHRAFSLGLLSIGATYDPERWPVQALSDEEWHHLNLAASGLGLQAASTKAGCSQTTGAEIRKNIKTKLNAPSLILAITVGHYAGLFDANMR